MGIQPSEAFSLSLHDYQGLVHNWQAAHSTDGPEPAMPDEEVLDMRRAALEAKGVKVLF